MKYDGDIETGISIERTNRDDRIIFIGGINSEDVNGRKVDAFTTYEIGSITKMFTATAVLQLCEQGKLSLDDTLDRFFPEFEYGKGITVYQLLHMQSGLRKDYVTEETFLSENGERDVEAELQIMEYGFPDRYDTKREGHLIVKGEEPVKEKDT